MYKQINVNLNFVLIICQTVNNFYVLYLLIIMCNCFYFFQNFTQPGVIEQVSYILIAIGALMFIVSFLGYCGALRESQCMLTTVRTYFH